MRHVVSHVRFNGFDDGSRMEVWCTCDEGPFGPGEEEGSWIAHKAFHRRKGLAYQNVWKTRAKERFRRKVEA